MKDDNNGMVLVKLAEKITSRACRQWPGWMARNREEVLSEAYVAVMTTRNRMPDQITVRGWSPRASFYAYGTLISGLRKQGYIKTPKVFTNAENILRTNDKRNADEDANLKRIDSGELSDRLLAGLPPEWLYIVLCWMKGTTLKTIAEELGMTGIHVRQMFHGAIAAMKRQALRPTGRKKCSG